MRVSVVVPCHNEAESLPILLPALEAAAGAIRGAHADVEPVEVVLVDDGSTDATLDVMRRAQAASAQGGSVAGDGPAGAAAHGATAHGATAPAHGAAVGAGTDAASVPTVPAASAGVAAAAAPAYPDLHVRWISLSRGFGKEGALYAGLDHATGDFVATMDADMQDPPALLPQMLDELLGDAELDSVATRRVTRAGEPPIRSAFARLFYRIMNHLSETEVVDGARDYRLMRRPMVDAVLDLGERNRFTKGIYGWVGFRTKWLAYENVERAAGETNWSFWKLAAYAVDGIVAFSTKPLALASAAGVVFCLLAFAALVFVVVRAALFGDPVAGWPSLVSLILLVSGIQLLCLGIFGQYLAKTYLETKGRPLYVVRRASDDQGPRVR